MARALESVEMADCELSMLNLHIRHSQRLAHFDHEVRVQAEYMYQDDLFRSNSNHLDL